VTPNFVPKIGVVLQGGPPENTHYIPFYIGGKEIQPRVAWIYEPLPAA